MQKQRTIRISEIYLQNFKGFSRLSLSLGRGQAVILGGLNGYGKTTIFDALELLFTGVIRRMDEYSPLHNWKMRMSQERLPLVFNSELDMPVVVQAKFIVGDEVLWLERHAEISAMSNPVRFEPFAALYIRNDEEKDFRPVSDEDVARYDLSDLLNNYSFLYYLSQEGAISFLKSKEVDRSNSIQNLFDTSYYDNYIQKVSEAYGVLIQIVSGYNQKKSALEEDIRRLTSTFIQGGESSDKYVPLSVDSSLTWDKENPNFSYEDYNAWLSKGGIIDGMAYFCEHRSDFLQYNRNKIIEKLLEDEVLHRHIVFQHYKDTVILKDFRLYLNIRSAIDRLTIDTVSELQLSLSDSLASVVIVEVMSTLDKERLELIRLHQASDAVSRIATNMLQQRNSLSQFLSEKNALLHYQVCPLCGAEYASEDELLRKIHNYGEQLSQNIGTISEAIVKRFNEFKQSLQNQIVAPLDKYFESQNVNQTLLAVFESANIQHETQTEENIKKILGEETNYSQPVSDVEESLRLLLSEKRKSLPPDLNIEWLNQIYYSYLSRIDWRSLKKEDVLAKQSYLISQWNKMSTAMMKAKTSEIKSLQKKVDNCEHKKETYKALKKELTNQRNVFVGEVISDIKILFYIYSGRIMQDCYFGRGLFMKDDFQRQRILFVSGNYSNDVDVLYNMSSGQLVSVSIAFLLALNKLYGHAPFLAIDDPVQTIDDINLWGLIETLRHDFHNHHLLLSTHEQNYGELLSYKLSKWGIITRLIDMAETKRHNMQN